MLMSNLSLATCHCMCMLALKTVCSRLSHPPHALLMPPFPLAPPPADGVIIAAPIGKRSFEGYMRDVVVPEAHAARAAGQPLKMLVLDSLTQALSKQEGSVKFGSNVGGIYNPLISFAKEFDVAVVVIAHTTQIADPKRPGFTSNMVRVSRAGCLFASVLVAHASVSYTPVSSAALCWWCVGGKASFACNCSHACTLRMPILAVVWP